ncbi:hypothetical protein GO495_31100 [Chitinophaga oryziterrae]|uniref:XRE family transcriptional regulator n=1 Tax=Chitinophaga oryziterrae TaxID=1031224 RepID=A0A6N8JL25_9BACT|nr:hypothetical protein [Chitinophaga oryziterrae]MVT45076.1 hypothetical protein [Chitinophaga oryziterrae]
MKDPRYAAVKSMLETGRITRLKDVFGIIPITVVHKDTAIHYATLHRRIQNPRLLTLDNFIAIAKLIDVKTEVIVSLALADLPKNK